MDEMNTNQEPVIEQRPSQKYGRTAYQQELQQEQNAESVQSDRQPDFGTGAQQWQPYTPYVEPKSEVKNIYASILMGLVTVSGILGFVVVVMLTDGYAYAQSLDDIYVVVEKVMTTPGFNVISIISDIALWLTIAFLVVDIMQLSRAGHKIVGAILFAILLRPAYFIWRAHLLKEKKTWPIVFTVCYYLLIVVELGITFSAAFDLAMRIA